VLFSVTGRNAESIPVIEQYCTWFQAGDVNVGFTFRADGLTAIMLVTVTFIGSLIAIYSVGYMHGDPGYPRFFAEIALFLFAMTGLVLADNFILLYAFWEGVGLCSYLLIGFWFTRPAAAAAARKAFLVTRIGDVGFFLGILLLFLQCDSVNFKDAFHWAATADSGTLTLVCLLLFCGAVGKSAQFPLHVWLPDAMEGPSPVSALIHAATMVTAGVYLVARCTPLFALSISAQVVVACIGGFTALLAALMALTQTDLKRVLAYSTISQLGYMFLALGSAIHVEHVNIVELGVTAAIFHLFTHAFFKALLFLAAGSVMHAMGDVIDMRRFGGLYRLLPYTHWTFLCGAAALAGIPLFAGFWSKDEILAATFGASDYSWVYVLLFVVALITAGLTAFYTFRAYFMTFWGDERIPHEAGHHAHESPLVMVVPLIVLAAGAVLVGMIFGPTQLFAGVLEQRWMEPTFHAFLPAHVEHGMNVVVMLGGTIFALAGAALAWLMYVRQPELPGQVAHSMAVGYEASRSRFYLDEIYMALIVQPLAALSYFCRLLDQYLVDELVDLIGKLPSMLGKFFGFLQNGLVQSYALMMILGLALFLVSMLLR
jgi:NADH-quinone oxidoreductase subunit L